MLLWKVTTGLIWKRLCGLGGEYITEEARRESEPYLHYELESAVDFQEEFPITKKSCLLSIKGLGCWMCSSFYTSPSSLYCWHECWAYCRKAWMGFTSAFVRISMARLWVWCVFLKIRSFLAWEMSIARWLARSVSIGILNRCVHSFRWKMDSWGH